MPLDTLMAGVMCVALIAYALFAGADFGGGIWDLLSRGKHAAEDRRAIAKAIGPVWEANHVWLIFLIVLLFTCFPPALAAVSVILFWPLHLVLVGIVLRGAAFVFRGYGLGADTERAAWGHIFGAASSVTPVLLGMCLGALSTGQQSWLGILPISIGILAVLLCAYLAAVYLAWETTGDVQERFRQRALITWFVAGVASVVTLFAAQHDAPRLWANLMTMPSAVFILVGSVLAPVSFVALWKRRYRAARVWGSGQVVALLLGWMAAQWPYLIYPDFTVAGSAAPEATLSFTAWTLPFGAAVLLPSLWFLFRVFKHDPRS
jgi:cytochrome d ubiquinol oxidase subunit II